MTTDDIPLSRVQQAAVDIAPNVLRTPLIRAAALEEGLGGGFRLFLKCENFQRSRSFKERGASFALHCLSPDARNKGVVTRSSGNFAQALALAGRRLGVAVTVVMPTNAPRVKVAGTLGFGATVVEHGTTHAEGLAKVAELQEEHGYTVLAPYDAMDTMTGQGTLGLEVLDDLPTCQQFFAPIGGGGLMGGCAAAIKQSRSAVQVIGVEPGEANDYALSRAAGERVAAPVCRSVADGLLAPMVGVCNWPVLQRYVDALQVVPDVAIVSAMRDCFVRLGMVVEPSGATALAGVMSYAARGLLQGDVVCVISGSNIDMPRFFQLLGEV